MDSILTDYASYAHTDKMNICNTSTTQQQQFDFDGNTFAKKQCDRHH
ncbi:hypothetical protein [Vitreoscilla sp. C1]|nr:hypothetical protein [Vitreoscilla sp. C1]